MTSNQSSIPKKFFFGFFRFLFFYQNRQISDLLQQYFLQYSEYIHF